MVQRLWLVLFVLLGACFSPSFRDGAITCGPNDECPPGMSCVNAVCRAGNLMQDASNFYTLTVAPGGNGTGTIASTPAGIDCGADCTENYLSGTQITLTPTAGVNSIFVGWSGACSGNGTCSVTLNQNATVTANFALEYSLVVALGGNGTGLVTSSPSGITCGTGGADCTEGYDPSTTVTLTALAANGSTFDAWSGSGATNCTNNGPCTVTMDAAKMVTATFLLETHALTVVAGGNGTGSVTSVPAGINCGNDCSEAVDYGSMVTLTAAPSTGSTFTGWTGGGCTGTGTCTVTMQQATQVTATWTLTQHMLTVAKAGNGAGTVTSNPGTISCGSGAGCMNSFDYNTLVTLSAVPLTGSVFSGWSGGGCGGVGACVVTMSAAATVTATFTLTTPTLTVAKAGNGDGTVTSTNPSGIDCGTDCNEVVNYGTSVTLMAAASMGSTFTSWAGGDCNGSTLTTCTHAVTSSSTVTATFTLDTHILTVATTGSTGSGLVSGSGITCTSTNGTQGGDCTESLNHNTEVTLTVSPSAGSTFVAWGGACNGNGACVVTMDMAKTVTAQFALNTYTLTVAKTGNGNGTVMANAGALTCGGDCNEVYNYGQVVQLTASEDTGSNFTGWTNAGACTTNPVCNVTIADALTVTANYVLETYDVNLTFEGVGGGTVTATPGPMNCTSNCNLPFNYNTLVTLNAAANGGSVFAGWSGTAGCTGQGSCQVTMTAARAVAATFNLGSTALTVQKQGTGTGTVTSDVPGINCGGTCAADFINGTPVTLTAVADTPASTFTGWTGDCLAAGMNPMCTVTVQTGTPLTAVANFALTTHLLTVMPTGSGSGTTTSLPGTISCPGTCSQLFDYGTDVQLIPTPSTGSYFSGWSGGGCLGTGSCTVDVTTATTVMASYTLNQYRLTASKTGTGYGTVTANVGFLDCGIDCDEIYNYNTTVTLTPTPTIPGSVFTGWSGACTGLGPCVITMDDDKTATANFDLTTHLVSITIGGTIATNYVLSITPDSVINCPGDCTETVAYGTELSIKPYPDTGYVFSGWTGSCTGTNNCDVTVSGDVTATATFAVATHTLTVATAAGTGSGSVASSPGGITCGPSSSGDCSEVYNYGQVVQLTPTASTGSTFTNWLGQCSGNVVPCVVTMNGDRGVGANFTLDTFQLAITKTGSSGQGTVTSTNVGGINCGTDCSEIYNYNQSVTLQAAATYGSVFVGWSGGGCSGSLTTCTVPMTVARTVNAEFDAYAANYVFIASMVPNGNMGGLSGADTICNNAASAAGGVPAGTYKAYLSTASTNAPSRLVGPLGTASGWIRYPDGRPVANLVSDLQSSHLFYPIKFDEFGTAINDTHVVYTATSSSGTYYDNGGSWGSCTNWTSTTGTALFGYANAVGYLWTYYAGTPCSSATAHIMCFGVDRPAVVAPAAGSYRMAFISGTWTPSGGIAGADSKCMTEATSAGLTAGGKTFKALLATNGASAISRFSTGSGTLPWARPDNTLVTASPADLTMPSLTHILAPPNSNAAGTTWYGDVWVWTGAATPATAGTLASTCNDWAAGAGTGTYGRGGFIEMAKWFGWSANGNCTGPSRLYCLQE